MRIVALDVGGANIKAADGRHFALSRSFALWQRPTELAAELRAVLAAAPDCDHVALTMTGELADCYATRSDGVRAIVAAAVAAAEGRTLRVYRLDGAFVDPAAAAAEPWRAAAANWHALARFAGRFAPHGSALLVDVGSTTCDLIPLVEGVPAAAGTSDAERLVAGELVYTGVVRSPVCALVAALPWRGGQCPVAQEVFATTRDAYVVLGNLPEDADARDTADGRPATRAAARDRLARSICADRDSFSDADAQASAQAIARAQAAKIAIALQNVARRLPSPPQRVIVSGQGEFLARPLVERLRLGAEIISLGDSLGAELSRVAPAHAVAVLYQEAAR